MQPRRDYTSVERTIPAPADRIFALLSDPQRHRAIDGSGTRVWATWDIGEQRGRSLVRPRRAATIVVLAATLERIEQLTCD